MNEFFPAIREWYLSPMILAQSFSEMRLDGLKGNEGSCLWLGRREQHNAVITRVVILRGAGILKQPDYLHISDDLMFEVGELAAKSNEVVLVQIHSHGVGYGTDLSQTDHRYGIRVPYFVSVVAPNYAYIDVPLVECGVHVFEPLEGYRRLERREIDSRFIVQNNWKAELVTAGGGL